MYDNAYKSGYVELKTFYPVWYPDVVEMDALLKAFGTQLDGIKNGNIRSIDNNFVATADAVTIGTLEKYLYITYDGKRTLEERRALVSAFFIGYGHIGRPEIIDYVSKFTEGAISVAFDAGVITVTVTRDAAEKFNLADALFILLRRIPAHLALVFIDDLLPFVVDNENHFLLVDLAVAMKIRNAHAPAKVKLDGRRPLDGTWLLNSEGWGLKLPDVMFAATMKAQRYGGSAALVTDSHNKLDGAANLDGSRLLDGVYKFEEL